MTEETAGPELREVYEHIKQQRGQARADWGPPNLHSLNPVAMRHTADLMWEIMRGDSRLTPAQREMIATVTSVAASCEFRAVAHAGSLRAQGGDELLSENLQNDWRKADLTPAEYAMLEYAEKLTIAPFTMVEDDIEQLRKAGWSDRDILDIVHVCAYFNFRVRIVDGLGLKLTEDRYEAARDNRSMAAAMAKERGAQLAPDIWGISRELGA